MIFRDVLLLVGWFIFCVVSNYLVGLKLVCTFQRPAQHNFLEVKKIADIVYIALPMKTHSEPHQHHPTCCHKSHTRPMSLSSNPATATATQPTLLLTLHVHFVCGGVGSGKSRWISSLLDALACPGTMGDSAAPTPHCCVVTESYADPAHVSPSAVQTTPPPLSSEVRLGIALGDAATKQLIHGCVPSVRVMHPAHHVDAHALSQESFVDALELPTLSSAMQFSNSNEQRSWLVGKDAPDVARLVIRRVQQWKQHICSSQQGAHHSALPQHARDEPSLHVQHIFVECAGESLAAIAIVVDAMKTFAEAASSATERLAVSYSGTMCYHCSECMSPPSQHTQSTASACRTCPPVGHIKKRHQTDSNNDDDATIGTDVLERYFPSSWPLTLVGLCWDDKSSNPSTQDNNQVDDVPREKGHATSAEADGDDTDISHCPPHKDSSDAPTILNLVHSSTPFNHQSITRRQMPPHRGSGIDCCYHHSQAVLHWLQHVRHYQMWHSHKDDDTDDDVSRMQRQEQRVATLRAAPISALRVVLLQTANSVHIYRLGLWLRELAMHAPYTSHCHHQSRWTLLRVKGVVSAPACASRLFRFNASLSSGSIEDELKPRSYRYIWKGAVPQGTQPLITSQLVLVFDVPPSNDHHNHHAVETHVARIQEEFATLCAAGMSALRFPIGAMVEGRAETTWKSVVVVAHWDEGHAYRLRPVNDEDADDIWAPDDKDDFARPAKVVQQQQHAPVYKGFVQRCVARTAMDVACEELAAPHHTVEDATVADRYHSAVDRWSSIIGDTCSDAKTTSQLARQLLAVTGKAWTSIGTAIHDALPESERSHVLPIVVSCQSLATHPALIDLPAITIVKSVRWAMIPPSMLLVLCARFDVSVWVLLGRWKGLLDATAAATNTSSSTSASLSRLIASHDMTLFLSKIATPLMDALFLAGLRIAMQTLPSSAIAVLRRRLFSSSVMPPVPTSVEAIRGRIVSHVCMEGSLVPSLSLAVCSFSAPRVYGTALCVTSPSPSGLFTLHVHHAEQVLLQPHRLFYSPPFDFMGDRWCVLLSCEAEDECEGGQQLGAYLCVDSRTGVSCSFRIDLTNRDCCEDNLFIESQHSFPPSGQPGCGKGWGRGLCGLPHVLNPTLGYVRDEDGYPTVVIDVQVQIIDTTSTSTIVASRGTATPPPPPPVRHRHRARPTVLEADKYGDSQHQGVDGTMAPIAIVHDTPEALAQSLLEDEDLMQRNRQLQKIILQALKLEEKRRKDVAHEQRNAWRLVQQQHNAQRRRAIMQASVSHHESSEQHMSSPIQCIDKSKRDQRATTTQEEETSYPSVVTNDDDGSSTCNVCIDWNRRLQALHQECRSLHHSMVLLDAEVGLARRDRVELQGRLAKQDARIEDVKDVIHRQNTLIATLRDRMDRLTSTTSAAAVGTKVTRTTANEVSDKHDDSSTPPTATVPDNEIQHDVNKYHDNSAFPVALFTTSTLHAGFNSNNHKTHPGMVPPPPPYQHDSGLEDPLLTLDRWLTSHLNATTSTTTMTANEVVDCPSLRGHHWRI